MSIAHSPESLLVAVDDAPDPAEVRNGVHYPSSDGEEVGENDWHATSLANLFSQLRFRYRKGGAYVAADMMMYYEEGSPRAVRVAGLHGRPRGVSNEPRYSWMSWVEEGQVLTTVFEFISKKNASCEDLGAKAARSMSRLGIPEYFLFDPDGHDPPSDRPTPRLEA